MYLYDSFPHKQTHAGQALADPFVESFFVIRVL